MQYTQYIQEWDYIPATIIATCIVGIIYFCTGDSNSRIDNRKNW